MIPYVYRHFGGTYPGAMKTLITDDRIPLTVSDIVEKRLTVLDTNQEGVIDVWWATVQGWWGSDFSTCDGIVLHPSGKAKVVRNSELLKKCEISRTNHKSSCTDVKYIGLNEDLYQRLDGLKLEYQRDDRLNIKVKGLDKGNGLSKIEQEIWKVLVQNAPVRRDYMKYVSKHSENEQKLRFSFNFLGWEETAEPIIAIWPIVITGAYDGFHGYDLRGSRLEATYLSHLNHNLVGVAPDLLKKANTMKLHHRPLEARILHALAFKKPIKHGGTTWMPIPSDILSGLDGGKPFRYKNKIWVPTEAGDIEIKKQEK